MPIVFDGAIAVSPKVLSDLLAVTGPITVSATPAVGNARAVTFNSDDFLVQIQKLVQQGEMKSLAGDPVTYPKQVLRDLTNAIFSNLASSTNGEQQELFAMAQDWILKKDVMTYASDPDFERFIASFGADGGVYDLPQNFNGDYLAVVDTNVNGGKSDAAVSSTVDWQSQIGTDGTMSDSVTVNRANHGDKSPYAWYDMTNQDYLQFFVPDGSSLTNESGGMKLRINPKINYAKSGYSTDPLVASIDATDQAIFAYPAVTTHEESGKEVFSTWAITKPGASTTVSIDDTHYAFVAPADGVTYQFIFEKQAGTVRQYSFEIDAPLGYQFLENGLPTYTYQSDDPPGRIIISITLQKI